MSRLVARATSRGNAEDIIAINRGRRSGRGANAVVSQEQAMRLSVAWACRRLRADLVSTMPIDALRKASGVTVETPKPPVMLAPGGEECRWIEWVNSSQMDLDGYGNAFGVIEERDTSSFHRPAVIRLVPAGGATVTRQGGVIEYRFAGESKSYRRDEVWHEKQYTIPGLPVGLSPLAHAAMTMNAALSAQEFANSWFGNGASPRAHLRNKARKLNAIETRNAKNRFIASVEDGDVFVSGNDWEYSLIEGKASESMFLEQGQFSNLDLCRFMGVPADMVDVQIATGTITYANITQRNLQFLIMNLNPALIRREAEFTYWLLPEPRFAKFNRGALLQMDLKSRYETYKVGIDSRFLGVDEARAFEDWAPLSDDQIAQFQTLFPRGAQTPALPGGTS